MARTWKTYRFSGRLLQKSWALLCVSGFLFFQAGALVAGANLEEKTRYEKALEQKVEEVLVKLLGPGKAKVLIQAVIDFSSKERVALGSAKVAEEALPFRWQNMNKPEGQELLPGFPVSSNLNPVKAEDDKFQREVSFPLSMVKRLTVSLVLNEDIAEADVQKVRRVVTNLLAMDLQRGDELLIMRARFAPIWYTAETFNMLAKYGIIALIAVIGMAIVAFGFLQMAGAMNNMAGSTQPQKISMEMGGGGNLPELEDSGGLPEVTASRDRPLFVKDAETVETGGAPADGLMFDIKPEKLGILVRMLAKDEPADISLIAVQLPAGLRSRFISLLPSEVASEVVANIASVRFVDPEFIAKVKKELERKMSGAVGGYEKVLEIIEKVDLKSKKALLQNLQEKHPEVAVQVRPRILFFEDIEKFSEKDLSILVGTVAIEQWSSALWKLSDAGRQKIKAQMTERAWKTVEQTMRYGMQPEEKIDQAIEGVMACAWKLINEGRVVNPNAAGPISIGSEAETVPQAEENSR